MKKITIITLFSFYILCSSMAYNYQPVYSHRTALFTTQEGQVKSMKIDSVKIDGADSVFYPMKNITQVLNSSCFTPYGPSWLGVKIAINSDWCVLRNRYGNEIRIWTAANTGYKWVAFNMNELYVEATVNKTEQLTFMGITDSVKTISFSAKIAICTCAPQKVKAKISDEFDGLTIQISKHYGLLKSFNFNLFPFTEENTSVYSSNWNQYQLVGMTKPALGLQNLTWQDTFDFQPGDEIHTIELSTPVMGSIPPSGYVYKRELITKYLSKTSYTDSVKYYKEILERQNDAVFSHYYTNETIIPRRDFDILPQLPQIILNTAQSNYMYIDNNFIVKTMGTDETAINTGDFSCWNRIISDAGSMGTYYKGLGGPYYDSMGLFGGNYNNSFVYYKKGTETWGTPLVISALHNQHIDPEMIYPNPTSGTVAVKLQNPELLYDFTLIDLSGRTILKSAITGLRNNLDLSTVNAGLYIYKLSTNGKVLSIGKITKL